MKHIPEHETEERPTQEITRGKAVQRIVTILVITGIILTLLAIAIPSFVKARNTACQNACINNLRMIDSGGEQRTLENWREIPLSVSTNNGNASQTGSTNDALTSEAAYRAEGEARSHRIEFPTRHFGGLPMRPSLPVTAIGWYGILCIGFLLLGRLANLFDPLPRERYLRWAFFVQVGLLVIVLGVSVAIICSHYGYLSGLANELMEEKWFVEESLYQNTAFYIVPTIVFGILGSIVTRYLRRSAKKAIGTDGSTPSGTA